MVELQALDGRIMEILGEDGRISNVELARRVGVSEKTVRQRIARLVEHSGLRFHAELDDDGRATQVVYLVTTEPGQRLVVADRLARLPNIDSVRLTTGGYDMVIEASFDSDADALEFFVRDIEAGTGVERSTSLHVIKSVRATGPAANDRFADFNARASTITTIEGLLDLACDVAGSELGTTRVFAGMAVYPESEIATDPLFSRSLRWRGLSSRYIDAIYRNVRAHSLVPTVASRGQHLFVADAETDPLFAQVADLVRAEQFHSFLSLPIRHNEALLGSLNLYYDTVIPFNAERIAQGQELADVVGKHLARLSELDENADVRTGMSRR